VTTPVPAGRKVLGFLLSIKYTKEWTTVQPDIPQTIISLHNSNAIAVAFAKHKAKHILRNEYGKYCVIHRLQNSLKFLQMEDVKIIPLQCIYLICPVRVQFGLCFQTNI